MPYRDYKIIREIRSGGTSRVYEVRDIDTDEILAMKLTSFKHVQKSIWLNEIQTLRMFQYVRGIVKLIEFGQLEDSNKEMFGYTILEHCGNDLFESPLKPGEEKTIFLFLFNVLTTMHAMGYCHCDLKPENVLRKGKGFRLCDFSSCQPIGTTTNILYGTPHVIAPELLKLLDAKKDYMYDEKVDSWGFGCLLFELLTEEQFDRNTCHERITCVKDSYYQKILKLCLEENPVARIRIWELARKLQVPVQSNSTITVEDLSPLDPVSGKNEVPQLLPSRPHPKKIEDPTHSHPVVANPSPHRVVLSQPARVRLTHLRKMVGKGFRTRMKG